MASADVSVSGTTAVIQVTSNLDAYLANQGFPGADLRIWQVFLYVNPALDPVSLAVSATPDATSILQGGLLNFHYNLAVIFPLALTPAVFDTLTKSVTIDLSGLPDGTSADSVLLPNPLGSTFFQGASAEICLVDRGYIPGLFDSINGGPGAFSGQVTDHIITNAVPSPPTLPLVITGLALMALLAWRRRFLI
jgi:hypothetical protein